MWVLRRQLGAALRGLRLDAQAAFEGLHRARELGHQALAGEAEDAAVGSLDFAAKAVEFGADPVVRLLLVALHHGDVAHDVRAENGGQPPFQSPPLGTARGRGQSVVSQHHCRRFCVWARPRKKSERQFRGTLTDKFPDRTLWTLT